MPIVALYAIPELQPVAGLVACTLYVPAAVCIPKSMLLPVPVTAAPTVAVPLYN